MIKTILVLLTIGTLSTAALVACQNSEATRDVKQDEVKLKEERIKRGEYLVSVIGCDDCHSPKNIGPNGFEVIPETRLSGYPASRALNQGDKKTVDKGWMMLNHDLTASMGPWGMSFAANLTSDETGIGNWKEEQFIKALREGKYKGLDGNRNLLPPMPWFVYKNMTDEDLKSIFAYLKSTKPVRNVVPSPIPMSELK